MLTASDIEKRIQMSKADCVIADFKTALRVEQGIGSALKKKILVEDSALEIKTQNEIDMMSEKGNHMSFALNGTSMKRSGGV